MTAAPATPRVESARTLPREVPADVLEREPLLIDQHASLRRIARLVADGAPSTDVFAAIAREAALLTRLPVVAVWRYDPGAAATVVGAWSEHGHPVDVGTRGPLDRIARANGLGVSAAGAIRVGGRVWGAISGHSLDRVPLPEGVEDELAEFAELVAAAIATTAGRDAITRLGDEQAALRRVATLVARDAAPGEVFSAVAREVGLLAGADMAHVARFEQEGVLHLAATWSRTGDTIPLGPVTTLEGKSVSASVMRTGRPARMDSYEGVSSPIVDVLRAHGIRSSVGAPIVVDGRRWGVMIVASKADDPLPDNTEARLAAFTELVATAISNAESRTEARRLTDEQAALRRVATLIARNAPSAQLFDAVTAEVGTLFGADIAAMTRYLPDGIVVAVASWAASGGPPAVPEPQPLESTHLSRVIHRTGRPAREDDWAHARGPTAEYVRDVLGACSAVACPIVVEGRVWGALFVFSTTAERLPGDTESRLAKFSKLVATAISNAQTRSDIQRLADEQAALRRVATLVAREPPQDQVFAAVAAEAAHVLDLDDARMVRFDGGATATVVASWGVLADALPVGTRISLEGETATALVFRTGRPARVTDFTHVPGPFAASLRGLGVRSSFAVPVIVDGQLWGAMSTACLRDEPLPPDSEARMEEFTELVATAISNVKARSELAASRARLVEAADEERRRVVRDLHDGAQQRLVYTVVTLKLAVRALARGEPTAAELVTQALQNAQQATDELRELAHGILPRVLTRGGLRAAAHSLANRMPVPIEIRVTGDRLPPAIEATAYYVVAEALTNVAKHARATHAEVVAEVEDGALRVAVRDDGVGGARPQQGRGLLGLADRVAVLDGELRVESPADGGTLVSLAIPVRGAAGRQEAEPRR